MNIDKNVITYPKQLIGGERRETGILQIFFQNGAPSRYATGLNGTYKLTLLDLKLQHDGGVIQEYMIQMTSDTFFIDRGAGVPDAPPSILDGMNNNFKFSHRTGSAEVQNPVVFKEAEIRNHVELGFEQLGKVGNDIAIVNYQIVLTFEYERL